MPGGTGGMRGVLGLRWRERCTALQSLRARVSSTLRRRATRSACARSCAVASPSSSLDARLHAEEHAPIHREADRLDERGAEAEARREVVRGRAAIAADEAAALLAERLDEEEPAHLRPGLACRTRGRVGRRVRDEEAAALERRDPQRRHLRDGSGACRPAVSAHSGWIASALRSLQPATFSSHW